MSALPETMSAWRLPEYNEDAAKAIASLTLADDVVLPAVGTGDLLVKVHYAAVNPVDWKLFLGGYHAMMPLAFPHVPGFDVAGVVVAVGSEITSFKVGDRVVGDTNTLRLPGPSSGSFGEFASLPASQAALVPDSVPLKNVAGLPLAGVTSYNVLFTGGGASSLGEPLFDLQAGQKVLIIGGASGTGHIAIQLAKDRGAFVATTTSANKAPDGRSKLEWVKQLGADVVINYQTGDWSQVLKGQGYDLIMDCVGVPEDAEKTAEVLKPGGQFISIINFNSVGTKHDNHHFKACFYKPDAKDLSALVALVAAGNLAVLNDQVYPFAETPQALLHNLSGRTSGKVVVEVVPEASAA